MADRVRVRGVTIHRPIIYGNVAVVLAPEEKALLPPNLSDHTHRWTVAVRSAASPPDSNTVGGADDLSYFLKRVTFKLHETYPNPSRSIDKPPFEVTETGWGEFEVQIRLNFVTESGEKGITCYHHIKLHPWTLNPEEALNPNLELAAKLGPVHSWQYDEVVFNDPFQNFLNILVSHAPTALPKTKRKPVPFHVTTLTQEAIEVAKGAGAPEFTQEMEKEEGERIEQAKKQVIAEQDKWRAMLIEKEKELEKLQKLIAEQQAT
ncbi:NuA4 histone H4 acetyltransferase complex and the SWR1 complex subunit [Steccherinum ochraceum]|uniref:Protein AF-9 homolog n=1 Tax=Steccherinum ochraceum TaxID=92696 RepID=A0A4V2MWR3_9APHY|nr:NuA4 histone H4 acetyltransferase complex and the SWR1 complex subunit [Steccherinum ochraceum]